MMDAKQLREIANRVDNREKLDIIYKDILLPKLLRAAERKEKEIWVSEVTPTPKEIQQIKDLGFKDNLKTLLHGLMKPYLEEKGFEISYTYLDTTIKFY